MRVVDRSLSSHGLDWILFDHVEECSIFHGKLGVELLLAVGAHFGLQPAQAHFADGVVVVAYHHGAPFLGVEEFVADLAGKVLCLRVLDGCVLGRIFLADVTRAAAHAQNKIILNTTTSIHTLKTFNKIIKNEESRNISFDLKNLGISIILMDVFVCNMPILVFLLTSTN